MNFRDTSSSRQFEIEIESGGPLIKARLDGDTLELATQAQPDGAMIIQCGGQRVRAFVSRLRDSIVVSIGPNSFTFTLIHSGRAGSRHSLATPLLTAPMPGKVLKIAVREGDQVEAGQPLITMEAMKMETTLSAEGPARVARIAVVEGQMVDAAAVLIELNPIDSSKPQSDR
jgi:biotin carboxyl carrier protein